MSKRYELAGVAGLAVLVLALVFVGQAFAQRSTPVPGGMMGGSNSMMGRNGGMMGMMGLWTPPSGQPTVTEQQARANAQKFLDTKFPGAKLPADTMAFPGYYTIDFEVNGQPAGMLSVNAYTGQVWYHTWHGQFLSDSGPQL